MVECKDTLGRTMVAFVLCKSSNKQIDTLAMAGWYLSELRMKNIREDKRPPINPKEMFKIRPPKKVTNF